MFEYDATTTRIFEMPPYFFFTVVGIVFSLSFFILLLLKYDYNIPRYTKIFLFSNIGLLAGAKLFGFLTGLYITLANNEPISLHTFLNTGIVYYGGVFGFISTFILMCKVWNKKVEYGIIDLVVTCVPLFHFWGRLGCFFAGCCYGKESSSWLSVLYTTYAHKEIITTSRIPIQLIEAAFNIVIFIVLLFLLKKKKCERHLFKIYILMYASIRIILELFRGDINRGVWNGISFSQITSVFVIAICVLLTINKKTKEREHEIN